MFSDKCVIEALGKQHVQRMSPINGKMKDVYHGKGYRHYTQRGNLLIVLTYYCLLLARLYFIVIFFL